MAQQRDTAAKRLIVDAHRQRIEFDGRAVTTNGRWDAAFLHCLAAGRHGSPNRAASVDVVQRALVSFGSRRPLAAAQWGRIIDRLRAALRQLDPTLTLEKRLCHAPRGKTGGPWWWHAGTDLALDCVVVEAPPEDEVGSAHSLAALDPGIALAQRPGGFDTLRLASRFKQAMEAWWKALPEHACELLADGPPWAAESDTLRALRQLRLAELHTGLGQFDAAVALLQSLSDQASPPAVLAPHIAVARWRLAYAQDPLAQHARVGDGLRDALSAYGQRGSPTLDATAWAEHCHLLALCERRTLEHDLPLAQGEDDLSARLEPLLRSAHAALLLFLVVRNYERAQHVCANLAYAHQKLAGWLRGEHWALAVEWHALSFALQASFGGAESSAWEYIFLGELWLDSPQAREAWSEASARAVWDDTTPEQLSFYDTACRVAQQLADPRQQAYTLLNRYRFTVFKNQHEARDDSLLRLAQLLADQPALHALLSNEGYRLPRLPRTGVEASTA